MNQEEVRSIFTEEGPFPLLKCNGEEWTQGSVDIEELSEVVKRLRLFKKSRPTKMPCGRSLHISGTTSSTELSIFASAQYNGLNGKTPRKVFLALYQTDEQAWGLIMLPSNLLEPAPEKEVRPTSAATAFIHSIATA